MINKINLICLSRLNTTELISLFNEAADCEEKQAWGKLYSFFLENDAESKVLSFFEKMILEDENIFAKKAALGSEISASLEKTFFADVEKLKQVAALSVSNINRHFGEGSLFLGDSVKPFLFQKSAKETKEFYLKSGVGVYQNHYAFKFEKEMLIPISNISGKKLEELKEYKEEKERISRNIECFLKGLPYSNMLLYGDKGTGKSSTVHAMLNRYKDDGLRIIEVAKKNLLSLPVLFEKLEGNPLKFIIFIDDLTLTDREEGFGALKASLEGSVSETGSNVLVCCTSNRRNIVAESFIDRERDVHLSDTLAEQQSLADRFGLRVLFDTPDKKNYIKIVLQLAKDKGINISENELIFKAEQFALSKGGRSPRRAQQFIKDLFLEKGKMNN